MAHALEHLVGLPWEAGAQGPHAYDCWGLFRHVQREVFGIEVPIVVAADYDDPHVLTDLFARHEERARWALIEAPVHGAGVLVRAPLHVGVWLDVDGGGVLHSVRGAGVVFTSDASWAASGFGRRQFYRFSGEGA